MDALSTSRADSSPLVVAEPFLHGWGCLRSLFVGALGALPYFLILAFEDQMRQRFGGCAVPGNQAPLILFAFLPAILLAGLLPKWSLWIVGCLLGLVPAAIMGSVVYDALFWRTMRAEVQRVDPLVQALHGFVAREGQAPDTLEELVPRDLDAVPGTILGAGRFEYERHSGDETTWRLRVTFDLCGSGFPTLDYESDEHYPAGSDTSAVRTRVGRWCFTEYH